MPGVACTDIPSVKANSSHDPKSQLSEYEMVSQIRLALSLNLGQCRPSFDHQYTSPGGPRNYIKRHELHAVGACKTSRRANTPSTRDRIHQGSRWRRPVNCGQSRTNAVPPGRGKSTESADSYIWELTGYFTGAPPFPCPCASCYAQVCRG